VIAGATVVVTDDVDGARDWIATNYGAAGGMPAYRAVLDRGGKAGPEDTAVLGDEEAVAKQLQQFKDAGTTEFLFCPVGTDAVRERTTRFALDYV
jgi:alkanesulfonate monooxygenase SsuD/methylene tetrahydromethanopterin reductase-like flavin-dependent oxidoreductase (luciferase family)